MKPTNEYKEAIANAIAFKHDNPSEKQATSTWIYYVNSKHHEVKIAKRTTMY